MGRPLRIEPGRSGELDFIPLSLRAGFLEPFGVFLGVSLILQHFRRPAHVLERLEHLLVGRIVLITRFRILIVQTAWVDWLFFCAGSSSFFLATLEVVHHVPDPLQRTFVVVATVEARYFILEVGPFLLPRQFRYNTDPHILRDNQPVKVVTVW